MKKFLLTLFLGMSSGVFLNTEALAAEIKPYNAIMHLSEKTSAMEYFYFDQQVILSQNFDGNSHPFVFTQSSNTWVVGNAVSASPNNSMYISNDAGATNAYTVSAESVSHASVDVVFPAGVAQGSLSFDFRCFGEGSTDYMRVWLVPNTYVPTSGTQITVGNSGGVLLSVGPSVNNTAGNLNGTTNSLGTSYQTQFRNLTFVFNAAPHAAQSRKLVFEWRNNASGGNQPPAAVDNIILRTTTCPAPTNIQVELSCADPTIASFTWTPGGTETQWEYAVTTRDAAEPTTGTIVNTNEADVTGLVASGQYTFWVRANCGGQNGDSFWVRYNFKAEASPALQSQPFCSPVNGGLIFPNVSTADNVPNYGGLACLGSTPNPVWYYLTIENNGPVNFQIIQNTQFDANGNPVGRGLDVDFIAWGPFTDMVNACEEIDLTNPRDGMIGCSYSAAAIENFSIPNAQAGQIYVLLMTNFNGSAGFIKLQQTNLNDPNAGQTDCSFVCNVTLPDDVIACEGTQVPLTAIETETGGDGTDNTITAIRWYYNNTLLDVNVYNTLTMTATQPGTYRIEVEKVNCTEEYSSDEFVLTWVAPYKGNVPNRLRLCDYNNDNLESFDLTAYESTLNIPSQFSYSIHATQADANANLRPISGMYPSGNSTIYVRVQPNALAECYKTFPLTLELIPVNLPANLPLEDVDICTSYIFPTLPANQRFTHYIKYVDIDRRVVEEIVEDVNFDDIVPIGFYTIFTEAISEDNCISTASHFVNVYACELQKGLSPNGDGLNDNLDLTNYKSISLKVYNRNGKEVYSHGLGYTNQWFGQDNSGNELPDGTYFIDLLTPFERFTQWIQLNRQAK